MLGIVLRGEAETLSLGEFLGKRLSCGMLLCLRGDLGAGKTTLAKGIAVGLGIKTPVTSPSFTIINEYPGRRNLYHIDTYRLKSLQELIDIGIEDYLPAVDGVTLIEWPEIMEELLPEERLDISLVKTGTEVRELRFHGHGNIYQGIIQELNTYESNRI
ncbi:MAG: tRNA (adenosine(37)-N6)-threonylcarbamoyltransferase complex ATPase subunit type 1 TsaE [Bacillota bacterium]